MMDRRVAGACWEFAAAPLGGGSSAATSLHYIVSRSRLQTYVFGSTPAPGRPGTDTQAGELADQARRFQQKKFVAKHRSDASHPRGKTSSVVAKRSVGVWLGGESGPKTVGSGTRFSVV